MTADIGAGALAVFSVPMSPTFGPPLRIAQTESRPQINLSGLHLESGTTAPLQLSGLLLRSGRVEKGHFLFHVTAPAERANALALLVIVKTRLFGEGLQTITALQEV